MEKTEIIIRDNGTLTERFIRERDLKAEGDVLDELTADVTRKQRNVMAIPGWGLAHADVGLNDTLWSVAIDRIPLKARSGSQTASCCRCSPVCPRMRRHGPDRQSRTSRQILARQHPSGPVVDPMKEAFVELVLNTRKRILGHNLVALIGIADHIVIGGDSHASLWVRGYLF